MSESPEMSDQLFEHIKNERHFLHDLSSPMMIAMGMLDALSESESMQTSPEERQRLEKAQSALNTIKEKVEQRRHELKEKTGAE